MNLPVLNYFMDNIFLVLNLLSNAFDLPFSTFLRNLEQERDYSLNKLWIKHVVFLINLLIFIFSVLYVILISL